jgi:hypothetical protein
MNRHSRRPKDRHSTRRKGWKRLAWLNLSIHEWMDQPGQRNASRPGTT